MADRPSATALVRTGMRRWALVLAALVLVVAVSPPVDRAAGTDLRTHMVQHLLLLTAAPPLVVLGLPLASGPRRRWLAAAVVAHGSALLAWHLPALYDAAARHLPVHLVEHLSLFAAGTALWWALGIGDGEVQGLGVLALFAAAVPGTLLGMALLLSRAPWYASYPDLADQQVAGALMLAPGGLVYALAGAALVVGVIAREGGGA